MKSLLPPNTKIKERVSMPTPIVGTSVVSAEAVKSLLSKRNPSPPHEVVDIYYSLEPQWGIRADVLICQNFLETEYLKSWWSQPPRRNPAGIGVTGETSRDSKQGDPAWALREDGVWVKGYSFADWTAAAQAHFAHISGYVYPDIRNNADKLSPRFFVFKQVYGRPTYGKAVNISDLNGKWAFPGTEYGQSIERIMATAATLEPAGGVVPKTPPGNSEDEAEEALNKAYNSHSTPVWAFGSQLAFKKEGETWKLYCERAVFAYFPQNSPPWNVIIEDVGRQQFTARYPNG
jgi:Mannosyl-glycoprotein endo-beta-N-acetylglucosaminidase